MSDYIFTASALTKNYGHTKALSGLTMEIPKGSIYGFVGRNGAGKTTLLRIMNGLQAPDSGMYTLFGANNLSRKIRSERRRVGAVVEGPAAAEELTASQNLEQQALILGITPGRWIRDLLFDVGLEKAGDRKVRKFSLGMKQRLGIAMALAGNPDFLMLDEPANGLDPEGIIGIRELIRRLNKERGVTILVSSHILEEMEEVATHYGFIERGRILKQISAKELGESLRSSLLVTVSDTEKLAAPLEKIGAKYRVLNGHKAEIFGSRKVTPLVGALAKNGCEVFSMTRKEETLESYYLKLIGGSCHA